MASQFERIVDPIEAEETGTVLDVLFGALKRGKAEAYSAAMTHWNQLNPAQRLRIQQESAEISGAEPKIARQCAVDLLLLDMATLPRSA